MSPITQDEHKEGLETLRDKVGQALHKAPQAAAPQAAPAAAPQVKMIAQHTVTNEDTLSHIALKYYGSAAEPYWRFIYNANKETIGADPGVLRPGIVLNIPEKPQI